MNLVFLLLTTAASGADPVPYASPAATTVVYPAAQGELEPTEKLGFFARLRNLFAGRHSAPAPTSGGCSCASAPAAARIAPMPAVGSQMPAHASIEAAPLPMKSEMMTMPTGVPSKQVSTPEPAKVEVNSSNPF